MRLLLLQDEPEALCYCKETQEACGSDNRTYETVCQMNEESVRSGNTVYLKHWGPCRSGNTLVSTWCYSSTGTSYFLNPLNPELNPICYLLALLAHHFLHVSRIMVKSLTLRLLMSYIYIYGAPILGVSRSHTMMQHSRKGSSG